MKTAILAEGIADVGYVEDGDELLDMSLSEGNWPTGQTAWSVVAHDDDVETVRAYSDDGHSYAGTIVRGVLRGDSE